MRNIGPMRDPGYGVLAAFFRRLHERDEDAPRWIGREAWKELVAKCQEMPHRLVEADRRALLLDGLAQLALYLGRASGDVLVSGPLLNFDRLGRGHVVGPFLHHRTFPALTLLPAKRLIASKAASPKAFQSIGAASNVCEIDGEPSPGNACFMHILPYTDALAPAFHDINAAWIADMFVLEDHDRHVLSSPREAIVDKGGIILFAATHAPEDGGEVIGTGALMPTAPGCYELTKMGVLADARGTGAGAALLDALIERARDLPDCDTLYLLTSAKCDTAIRLYERAGFVHDADIMARFGAAYARCNVAMRYPPALLAAA